MSLYCYWQGLGNIAIGKCVGNSVKLWIGMLATVTGRECAQFASRSLSPKVVKENEGEGFSECCQTGNQSASKNCMNSII